MSRRTLRNLIPVLIFLLGLAAIAANWRPVLRLAFPIYFKDSIGIHSKENRMDPLLLAALVRIESGYNPAALSPKGARGLLQVMPETASWAAGQMGIEGFHPDKLYDPEYNLRIGAWYFATLRTQFGGSTVVALAAYNGGRANVELWLQSGRWSGREQTVNQIPFPETRSFVTKVLSTYSWYKLLYAPAGGGVRFRIPGLPLPPSAR